MKKTYIKKWDGIDIAWLQADIVSKRREREKRYSNLLGSYLELIEIGSCYVSGDRLLLNDENSLKLNCIQKISHCNDVICIK
jgi:hypothetical protein